MADQEAAGMVTTTNPATGDRGRSYTAHDLDQARAAARAALEAQRAWRKTSFAERSAIIRKAGALLRERADRYAALMTEEMGKTLDRKSTRLNSSHTDISRMPSSA